MKRLTLVLALGILAPAALANHLRLVPVDAAALPCLFNPACTNIAETNTSPIFLPGTTGTGYLHTVVTVGEPGSPAAGRYAYRYHIDLSGVVPTNDPPCTTNVVRCTTTRVETVTNIVTCRTSVVGVVRRLICVTNRFPATNVVTCVSNFVPATNVVQCFTNGFGVFCFTNDFPETNFVFCITNRIPARSVVVCQTNIIDPGTEIVRCTTNRVVLGTNIVTCRTNTIPCPGSAPCIRRLKIAFGSGIARLDFDTNGTTSDRAFVVSNEVANGASPSEVELDDGDLVIRFWPPLCPGESSFAVGVLAATPPRDAQARLKLTSDETLRVDSRAPSRPIDCDFDDLEEEIEDLNLDDVIGDTREIRRERRAALLAMVQAAVAAAHAGDATGLLAALDAITARADGGTDDWVTGDGAEEINDEIEDIRDCLEDKNDDDEDDD